MVNTIWKEVFLIMCSHLKGNARYSGRFPPVLRITEDYTLQMLCGSPHKVCNDEGLLLGLPFNRSVEGGYGGICGTFFVCGLGEDNFASLSPELMEKYREKFRRAEMLLGVKGNTPITFKTEAKPKARPEKPKPRHEAQR